MTDAEPGDRASSRRQFLRWAGGIGIFGTAGCGGNAPSETPTTADTRTPPQTPTTAVTRTPPQPPTNVIFIMADDMGYGDTSVDPFTSDKFGGPIPTPNLEVMASNGARFTSHYNGPAPLCTPTRAALLTGSYHARVGVGRGVYRPESTAGMHPDETTVAELVQAEGYATGMVGKWHLGHYDPYLPPNQGFDESYAAPYSNDMFRPIPLIEGTETLTKYAPNDQFTQRYTERALQFIDSHQDEPFFLYLAHTMPHIPLGVSDSFDGETGLGTYPDVIHELDWSIGQILDKLTELGIKEDTLVVFTSDDGPWLRHGKTAGSSGPLQSGKGTTYEGGARVPTIMHWPGTIPGGSVCDAMTSHIDILPTVANLMGTDLPDNEIDGKDFTPVLLAPESASSPHDHIMYYDSGKNLGAIRNAEGFKYEFFGGTLYNLKSDIGEQTDVSDANPDVVHALKTRGESLNDRIKDNARPEGTRSNIAYVSIRSTAEQGVNVTFTNNTDVAVTDVTLSVASPDEGWEVTARSSTAFDVVDVDSSVEVNAELTSGGSKGENVFVHARATYKQDGKEDSTETGEDVQL